MEDKFEAEATTKVVDDNVEDERLLWCLLVKSKDPPIVLTDGDKVDGTALGSLKSRLYLFILDLASLDLPALAIEDCKVSDVVVSGDVMVGEATLDCEADLIGRIGDDEYESLDNDLCLSNDVIVISLILITFFCVGSEVTMSFGLLEDSLLKLLFDGPGLRSSEFESWLRSSSELDPCFRNSWEEPCFRSSWEAPFRNSAPKAPVTLRSSWLEPLRRLELDPTGERPGDILNVLKSDVLVRGVEGADENLKLDCDVGVDNFDDSTTPPP